MELVIANGPRRGAGKGSPRWSNSVQQRRGISVELVERVRERARESQSESNRKSERKRGKQRAKRKRLNGGIREGGSGRFGGKGRGGG